MGERFGPYELGELLGRGATGEVHRARDTRRNRGDIALKRLAEAYGADEEFQHRFLDEAEMTARLREPHVIPIHDYGQIDGRPYLDMRLVEGVDLGERLARHGRLAPGRAVDVITQIASALDAAHRDGLVHRDIKPQNVLFDQQENGGPSSAPDFVYLIDFGIAANMLASRRGSTLTFGAPAYTAPERFTAGGDHRVDIYALGCLLHEMLVGTPPFQGDLLQLMGAHAEESPPAVSSIRMDLPSGFDDVIATALAKDPDRRHSTAGAFAAAARSVLETVAVSASVGKVAADATTVAPAGPRLRPEYSPIPHPPPAPPRPGPPGAGAHSAGSPSRQPTNALAIAALILGFVIAPAGVMLGLVARKQISRSGESGRGLAVAGIVVGSLLTVLSVMLVVIALLAAATTNSSSSVSSAGPPTAAPTSAAVPTSAAASSGTDTGSVLDRASIDRVFTRYMTGLADHNMTELRNSVCPRYRDTLEGFALHGYYVGRWEMLPYNVTRGLDYVYVYAYVTQLDPNTGAEAGQATYGWYIERDIDGTYYSCGWSG